MSSQEPFTPITPEEVVAHNTAKNYGFMAGTLLVTNLLLHQSRTAEAISHYEATHDELTGLPNLKGYNEFIDQNGIEKKAFLLIDGTNQKGVNDTLGHQRGDDAILGTRDAIVNSIRKEDFAARIGGDEFVVVLDTEDREEPPSTPEEQVAVVRGRIASNTMDFLRNNPDLNAEGFDIAVGGAVWEPGMTLDDVKNRADADMYADKKNQHAAKGAYRPA